MTNPLVADSTLRAGVTQGSNDAKKRWVLYDEPEFDEVLPLGKELREAENQKENVQESLP